MFPGTLGCSLAGKALENGLWNLNKIDIRDFANNKNGKVDDVPFGCGPGMVINAEVLDKALSRTSAFITIPGPQPNGTSSTLPFLLFAKSLMSILLRFHKPFSRALPANEQPKVPGNISGNNVRTVAFHTKNSSC